MNTRDMYENYEIERAAQANNMMPTKRINTMTAGFLAGVCMGALVVLFLFKLV